MDSSAGPLPPPSDSTAPVPLPPPTLPPHAVPTPVSPAAPAAPLTPAAPAAPAGATPALPATPLTATTEPSNPSVPAPTPASASIAADGWTSEPDSPTEQASSRRGLMLAVAVVCLLALGVGALFLLRGDDTSDDAIVDPTVDDGDPTDGPPVDAGAYSFTNATTNVDASPAMRFSTAITSPEGDIDVDVLVDRRERRSSVEMEMDLSEVGGMVGGPVSMRMIVDEPAATMYMSTDVFDGFATDRPWVSISGPELDDALATDDWYSDPADLGALFLGTEPTDHGIETVDGEQLKHYEVTLSIEQILEIDPEALEGLGGAELTALDSLTYHVWVDEASRLRLMTFDVEVEGEAVSFEMSIDHIDEPVSIPRPDPADVMSFDEMMTGSWGELAD